MFHSYILDIDIHNVKSPTVPMIYLTLYTTVYIPWELQYNLQTNPLVFNVYSEVELLCSWNEIVTWKSDRICLKSVEEPLTSILTAI